MILIHQLACLQILIVQQKELERTTQPIIYKNIHEPSSRIDNCNELLKDYVAILKDKVANQSAKNRAAAIITGTIGPALNIVVMKIRDRAVIVALKSSSGYVHKREKQESRGGRNGQ